MPPIFSAPQLDSKFNVDYDFATKNYQIQSDGQAIEFCVMPKLC